MKKATKAIIISIILLILLISFKISGFVTGEVASENVYSWTKAICNETSCQDYEIFCKGNELINQTAITGAIMNIPENWIDPRNETNKERVCE